MSKRINWYPAVTNTKILRNSLIVLALFVCTSCGLVTESYQQPDIDLQPSFRDVPSMDTSTIAAIPWRSLFKDSVLLNLIEDGLSGNNDLKIAVARIKQAEAGFDQSKLALWPNLSAEATTSITQSRQNGSTVSSNEFQLALNASWEIDIWGKLTSAKRASLAALLETQAYRNAVVTRLIADIANTYYSLLAFDAQLEITRKTVAIRIADVNTMNELKANAVVTGAAVVQSEANRYAAEVTIPDIKQNIRAVENSLCILLGRSPGKIQRSTLEDQKSLDTIQVGIPAQLLSNRPDVMQAEFAFRSAFEISNVARTWFYPALTITGSESITEEKLSDLFNPGTLLGNVVGGLTQPIFNQGINTTRLETAKAKQEEALLNYKQAILVASGEVSDALAAFSAAIEKAQHRKNQIDALEKAVDYTKQLLIYGTANYTEVLSAEQNLLSAKLGRINDKLQQLQSIVVLYRSLGGGMKQ